MAAAELLDKANLTKGQILVVGCSSSEIIGSRIGSASSPEVAEAVWEGIFEAASSRGVYVAAQCCEHLNRAIIVERRHRQRRPAAESRRLLRHGRLRARGRPGRRRGNSRRRGARHRRHLHRHASEEGRRSRAPLPAADRRSAPHGGARASEIHRRGARPLRRRAEVKTGQGVRPRVIKKHGRGIPLPFYVN